jgi:hypothetical protein
VRCREDAALHRCHCGERNAAGNDQSTGWGATEHRSDTERQRATDRNKRGLDDAHRGMGEGI